MNNRKMGCGKKFWTCFYGSSLLGYFYPIVGWHRVKCGDIYYVEGLALCKDCRNNLLDKRSKKLNQILKGSFLSKSKKIGVIKQKIWGKGNGNENIIN